MPSAAILAGGTATRYDGRDKSSLLVGGRTILERQLTELSRLTDDIMIVGRAGRAPRHSWRRVGVRARIVPDRVRGRGPLGGLDAALEGARQEPVVVLACDMPFVSAALLEHLIGLAAGHDMVVPRTERGYHPLCAVYARSCRQAVSRRLADGRLALKDLMEEVRVRIVTGDELAAFGDCDRLLANVNTAADYETIEPRHGHHV